MKLIEFNLKLKTRKDNCGVIEMVNSTLGCKIEEQPFEKAGEWIVWKSIIFSLQIKITFFADTEEYYIEGYPSPRILFRLSDDNQHSGTDISIEVLNFFTLHFPEENWQLSQ